MALVGIDDLADFRVELQERHELCPRGLPHPHDRRILAVPGLGELGEAFPRCWFCGWGVNRPQTACESVPVLDAWRGGTCPGSDATHKFG